MTIKLIRSGINDSVFSISISPCTTYHIGDISDIRELRRQIDEMIGDD